MRPLVHVSVAIILVSCAKVPPAPLPAGAAPPASPRAHATSDPTRLTPAQSARDASFAPQARAILGAYSNVGALVTRAGAVIFLSDRDGLSQLYVGDAAHPAAAARRLPSPAERVVDVALTADEHAVLFRSDTSGDGNFHVFRVGLDGQGLSDLTPEGTLHRDPPAVARAASGLFGYSAHSPSSEATRVFLQREDGGTPREVYADPRGGELVELSSDGARALYVRENADDDQILFEIETATGHATRLFPPEGHPARVTGVYSARGDRVFASRDVEGLASELVALDRSGKALARYEETRVPTGSLGRAIVSPSGDRVAVRVDAGNHAEVRVLDASTLRLERTLDVPPGSVGVGAFTKDGAHFTVSLSRPDVPHDVFLVDAATGVLRALRDDARPGLSAMAPIRTSIESLRAFDGLTISSNVYLPSQGSGRLPTLVLVHGGPSSSAYTRWNPAVRFFASLGYAIVEPNIRGSNGFGFAFQKADDKEKRGDALKDVATVNAWARAQAWCDPDRLVIMGTSYGGYMTLLALGRQPALWRAGIDVSGMSDLRTMERLEDQSIRMIDETEFGALGREDALLYEWSPIKTADAIRVPVFVYQGARDPITPQNEADQIVTALRERRVPVEYMLLSDEGHGVFRRDNIVAYWSRVARFLEENAAAR